MDSRREPDHDWVWSRTAAGALVLLRGGCVERISLAVDELDDPVTAPVLVWLHAYGGDHLPVDRHRRAGRHILGQVQSARIPAPHESESP